MIEAAQIVALDPPVRQGRAAVAAAVLEGDRRAVRGAVEHHRLVEERTAQGLLLQLMPEGGAIPLVPEGFHGTSPSPPGQRYAERRTPGKTASRRAWPGGRERQLGARRSTPMTKEAYSPSNLIPIFDLIINLVLRAFTFPCDTYDFTCPAARNRHYHPVNNRAIFTKIDSIGTDIRIGAASPRQRAG